MKSERADAEPTPTSAYPVDPSPACDVRAALGQIA
jgi:hypothetical protein